MRTSVRPSIELASSLAHKVVSDVSLSVLVKCKLVQTTPTLQHTIFITIPLEDRLTTIKDLKEQVVAKVTGLLKLTVGSMVNMLSCDLLWGKSGCEDTQEMEYFMPLHQPLVFKAEMTYENPQQQIDWEKAKLDGHSFKITVKGLILSTFELVVTQAHVTSDIKTMIGDKNGIYAGQHRLFFGGRHLEDDKTLGDYNIQHKSTIHYILRLRGRRISEISFANISDSGNMIKQELSTTGPSWRVARRGLCVEGYCLNKDCKAHEKMIICNKGMGTFDFVVDAHSVKCPECEECVVPETCAFNNCEWRYTGVKMSALRLSESVRSPDWKLANDQYERITDASECKVDWSRLLISTREFCYRSFNTECSICLEGLESWGSDPEVITECGHKYHISCLDAWKKLGKSTCPFCVSDL